MKRKIIAAALTVVMLFAFSAVCLADEYAFEMEASSDTKTANNGDTFSVTFYVNKISHADGILAIDAYIRYNPSHLKLAGIEGIVPSSWEKYDLIYSENSKGAETEVEMRFFWDGSNFTKDISVFADDQFGFKVDFNVITANSVSSSVVVVNDNLSGTTGLSSLESVSGLGTSYTISLNKTNSAVDDNSGEDMSSSFDGNTGDQSVNSDESQTTSENSSSLEETSSPSGESPSDEGDSAEDIDDVNSQTPSDASLEGSSAMANDSDVSSSEGSGGFGFIGWIAVVCIIIAGVAVVVYVLKNKKNDMNPVNPG